MREGVKRKVGEGGAGEEGGSGRGWRGRWMKEGVKRKVGKGGGDIFDWNILIAIICVGIF